MSTSNLIFPCVFSDDQFITIDQVRNELTGLLIELSDISIGNVKLLNVDIYKVIQDLKEIVSYKNIKGYRYNSYILRMAILKMFYIVEVIKASKVTGHYPMAEVLLNFTMALSDILDQVFEDYRQGL